MLGIDKKELKILPSQELLVDGVMSVAHKAVSLKEVKVIDVAEYLMKDQPVVSMSEREPLLSLAYIGGVSRSAVIPGLFSNVVGTTALKIISNRANMCD